jgi:hypothetical protein
VAYCCAEHQKKDWKTHKKLCSPFTIKTGEDGKYFVASRDLKTHTILINEDPILLAGNLSLISKPIFHSCCIACCVEMTQDSIRQCSTCGWPVCGRECEEVSNKFMNVLYTSNNFDQIINSFFSIFCTSSFFKLIFNISI